jgi:5-hydroxyisourate hydrolase
MISTHILDTTRGTPADNVVVILEKSTPENWCVIEESKTNIDGRIVFNCPKEQGTYRLTFFTDDYFAGKEHFFLNPQVAFRIENLERKYHVPIILNPYGYSTYRGS